MDIASLIALLGGAVGLIGGITGILSWFNQRKQTRLMQQQIEVAVSQNQSYAEWSAKYDRAIDALTKIYPALIYTGPSTHTAALGLVFPEEDIRQRIERYIGDRSKWSGQLKPNKLSRDHLLNPVVQQVIEDVLARVERFKREHPDWARTIKLMPSA